LTVDCLFAMVTVASQPADQGYAGLLHLDDNETW